MLFALAGVMTIAITAVAVVLLHGAQFPPIIPAKPISQSSTTPVPDEQRAAQSLSELLAQSAVDRVTVARAVDGILNCAANLPQAPKILSSSVVHDNT